MQITTHLQLIGTDLPASSNQFFTYLLTLIHLEPFNVDDLSYTNLNLDRDLEPLSYNFDQMGYITYFSIINLACSAYWFLYFPAVLLLVFLLGKIPHKWKKIAKFIKNLRQRVLPNTPIIFLNETYIMICTSFFLNCLYFKFDTYGNISCSLFTILLGGISISFPIYVAAFYYYHFEKIGKDEVFTGRWCKLVEELNF